MTYYLDETILKKSWNSHDIILAECFVYRSKGGTGFHCKYEQAGAELGQARLKVDMGFTSVYLYKINEQEILLARLTPITYRSISGRLAGRLQGT